MSKSPNVNITMSEARAASADIWVKALNDAEQKNTTATEIKLKQTTIH